MKFIIPGEEELIMETIILDLNGTLTIGGKIVDGVKERLERLKMLGFKIVFFSGDTRGNASDIAHDLDIEFIKAATGKEKKNETEKLNTKTCVAIGNGLIDLEMMKIVRLGIVVLQSEGVHIQTLLASTIIVPTINDALDLFLDSERLIATLRR